MTIGGGGGSGMTVQGYHTGQAGHSLVYAIVDQQLGDECGQKGNGDSQTQATP